MTSRERLLTAMRGGVPDHVPLVCRVFGFPAPPGRGWARDGEDVSFWYTGRLEHIHTLPQRWELADEFQRVEAWMSLGVDDVLEVSPPWGIHPEVRIREYVKPAGSSGRPVACREYTTPAGVLTHEVERTGETIAPGWVVQPEFPPLIEDFNIPRSARPALVDAADLAKLRYLLCSPNRDQLGGYRERIAAIRRFADDRGVLVAGWSLFGFDLVVWLCGAERAVMLAMLEPETFGQLVELVDTFDRMRTELMLEVGGVDLVVQRGWYSSTDFWSPELFARFLLPRLKGNVARVHAAGAKFAYVMTTGVRPLLGYLVEAGVDLYCWVDPVQGDVDVRTARELLCGKVAIAGGVNAPLTLGKGSAEHIRRAVREAMETLGPAGFVLEPVDSLFPDTPWEAVETMIEAWKEATSEVRG